MTCFNSEGNSPLSMQDLKFSAKNLSITSLFSLMILVGISSCWQDFYNVEITDNLFNFMTANFSEMKSRVKRFSLDFGYTRVFVERFDNIRNKIKIFTCHRKSLRFSYVQSGYYIRDQLIKVKTNYLRHDPFISLRAFGNLSHCQE